MIQWRRGVVAQVRARWAGAVEYAVALDSGESLRALGSPDALPSPVADVHAVPGHLVKARYTPTQTMVLGVDEQDSEHHALLRDADDLAGMPVVVADLHSSLPAVLAGLRESDPTLRV